MIKNKLLALGLLFLPSCSAIVGPMPTFESQWPFGDAKHVVLEAGENKAIGKNEANPENRVDIYNDSPYDRYEINNQPGIAKGKIWFKKGPNGYTGYAFSMPRTDEEMAKNPPSGEELIYAIYTRTKIQNIDGKTKVTIHALPCDDETKKKSNNCEFKTEKDTWKAVFNAPIPKDKEGIVEMDLTQIDPK